MQYRTARFFADQHKTIYAADKVGRMTDIGASGMGDAATGAGVYASGIQYRAFGAMKGMTLSTTHATAVTMTYDSALRLDSYHAGNNAVSGVTYIQNAAYTYGSDGMVRQVTNNPGSTTNSDHTFDQKNKYDAAARLKLNDVGPPTGLHPFGQTMSFDAFSNLDGRSNDIWQTYSDGFTATYANNRKTSNSDGTHDDYDLAGNVVESFFHTSSVVSSGRSNDDWKYWYFDAAGRLSKWKDVASYSGAYKDTKGDTKYDGDGRTVRTAQREDTCSTFPSPNGCGVSFAYFDYRYFLISSVTGQKITDIQCNGWFGGSHVYMGAAEIQESIVGLDPRFKIADPVTGSNYSLPADGSITNAAHTELAALDTNVPLTQPQAFPEMDSPAHAGFAGDAENGCTDNFRLRWLQCTFARMQDDADLYMYNHNGSLRHRHGELGAPRNSIGSRLIERLCPESDVGRNTYF